MDVGHSRRWRGYKCGRSSPGSSVDGGSFIYPTYLLQQLEREEEECCGQCLACARDASPRQERSTGAWWGCLPGIYGAEDGQATHQVVLRSEFNQMCVMSWAATEAWRGGVITLGLASPLPLKQTLRSEFGDVWNSRHKHRSESPSSAACPSSGDVGVARGGVLGRSVS